MENRDLIERLAKMGARETKADYDIGDYWNAVDEAHDALEECDSENAALRREVEALRKLCSEAAQYILLMDIPDAMANDYYDRLHRAAKGE